MSRPRRSDRLLLQVVDSGVAEAARRAGPWLACRPGCLIGEFPAG